MSVAAAQAARARAWKQAAMSRVVRSGRIPRAAFRHLFIESDGLHSRIHLQNFYSVMWPHLNPTVDGVVEVFAADGRRLGRHTFELAPFGALFLEMRELLATIGASEAYGSVAVELLPPPQALQELAEFPIEDAHSLLVSTPFWMTFYDEAENYMYVHSIDRHAARRSGATMPVNWLLARQASAVGQSWRAGRLLDTAGLTQLQLALVNHSAKRRETVVSLREPGGDTPVWEQAVPLGPCATARLNVDVNALKTAAGEVRLGVDPLPTANGKPYVLLKYGSGPLSVHHG
jgi:hypothetical protein